MVKGRKIFVSYGNENYSESLERLRKMAIATGRFDEVIINRETDLPEFILKHPLMHYSRGGGYWLWKPYVILSVLKQCGPEDIVVYCDGGNEVFPDREWEKFFKLLRKHSAVFFKQVHRMAPWTRRNLLEYFSEIPFLEKEFQLMSGLSLWTKRALPIAEKWFNLMSEHPEFVRDVTPDELPSEAPEFIENRHNQSVLSCVVFKYLKEYNLRIMWEHSEVRDPWRQAVLFARITNECKRNSVGISRFRYLLRHIHNRVRDWEFAVYKLMR